MPRVVGEKPEERDRRRNYSFGCKNHTVQFTKNFYPSILCARKRKFFHFQFILLLPHHYASFFLLFLSLSLSTFHSTFIFSFDLHVLQSDEKDDSEDNNIILDTYSLLTHTHFTFHILLTLFAFFLCYFSLTLSAKISFSSLSLSARISFPSIITQVFIIILFFLIITIFHAFFVAWDPKVTLTLFLSFAPFIYSFHLFLPSHRFGERMVIQECILFTSLYLSLSFCFFLFLSLSLSLSLLLITMPDDEFSFESLQTRVTLGMRRNQKCCNNLGHNNHVVQPLPFRISYPSFPFHYFFLSLSLSSFIFSLFFTTICSPQKLSFIQ